MGLFIASSVIALFLYREAYKIWTTLKESRKRCAELEEHLGVPLNEDDLVPGAQYLRVDPPEGTIFVKRVGTTVSDPLIRAVSFDGLNAGLILSNTVFSVIQSEDGTRMLFSKKGAIAPATVKAS